MQVEDTADFALKLFATVNQLRKDRKAGEISVSDTERLMRAS